MKERILTLGIERLCREKFNHINNFSNEEILTYSSMNKPPGSLWGSTFTPGEKYCSDWDRWCTANCNPKMYDKYSSCAATYKLSDAARLYTIDSLDDWLSLLRKYPSIDNSFVHMDGVPKVFLDYEKLVNDIDCIHLTINGNRKTHWLWNTEIDISGQTCSVSHLNSWDVESWLILNFDAVDLDTCQLYERDK